jgi:hypothetical protein
MKITTSFKLTLALLLFLNVDSFSQTDKFIIGDNNNGQIIRCNLDGTDVDTVDLGGLYQSYYDADIDPINQKIYMSWYYGIYWMNYDGTDFDTLYSYPSGGYSDGITVDPVNGFVYWTSTYDSEIYRADLAVTNIDTIFTTTGYLGDIDLDLITNKLYFTKWLVGAEMGVYVVDTNGANMDTIVFGYDAHFIGLDMANEVVYFADGGSSRKVNYDQTNDVLLFNFQPGGFLVDTLNAKLYVTNITANNLQVSDLDGTNASNVFATTPLAAPFGPVIIPYTLAEIETPLAIVPELSIYPNPAGDQIRITGINQASVLFIYNLLGELVLTTNVSSDCQLDISELASGSYTVSAVSEGKTSAAILVVKK